MKERQLRNGAAILAGFALLAITGAIFLLRDWKSSQAAVGRRHPLPALGYCASTQVRPCILSFSLQPGGNMQIDMLTNRSQPDFYLKIRSDLGERTYPCEKAPETSTLVSCRGRAVKPGEVLQFLLISTQEDTDMAEGQFPVIGLALATPEIFQTPTPREPLGKPPR